MNSVNNPIHLTMSPLVSILIPTYNRPESLLKAVRSSLLQSYSNIEVIITDNSLEHETNEQIAHIKDARILYVKNEANIGPVLNWRKVLGLANGKYCVILPDDDFFINPFYIEETVTIAEKNGLNLIITNCIIGHPTHCGLSHSNYNGLIKGKIFRDGFWDKYHIPTISNLFNRTVALSLNAFHSNEILYSDIELWLKMMGGEENIYCYQYPSVCYCFHGKNIVTTMSHHALVKNSEFIRLSLGDQVSDRTIRELAYRYIMGIDSTYHSATRLLVKQVLLQNGLQKGSDILFVKLVITKLKNRIIQSPRNVLQLIMKFVTRVCPRVNRF